MSRWKKKKGTAQTPIPAGPDHETPEPAPCRPVESKEDTMSNTNPSPYEELNSIGRHPTAAQYESVGITPTGNAVVDMMMLEKARKDAAKAAARAEMVSGTMVYRKARDEDDYEDEVVPPRLCHCGQRGSHSHVKFAEGWA